MVRRGSPVRVRQRALRTRWKRLGFLLQGVKSARGRRRRGRLSGVGSSRKFGRVATEPNRSYGPVGPYRHSRQARWDPALVRVVDELTEETGLVT